jgi:sialic acid synthase SpsE
VNAPLLNTAARSALPLILSTGAADIEEIDAAVARLRGLLSCQNRYQNR